MSADEVTEYIVLSNKTHACIMTVKKLQNIYSEPTEPKPSLIFLALSSSRRSTIPNSNRNLNFDNLLTTNIFSFCLTGFVDGVVPQVGLDSLK